jgi:hypothetical protein
MRVAHRLWLRQKYLFRLEIERLVGRGLGVRSSTEVEHGRWVLTQPFQAMS